MMVRSEHSQSFAEAMGKEGRQAASRRRGRAMVVLM
jgi:hypothetical protein